MDVHDHCRIDERAVHLRYDGDAHVDRRVLCACSRGGYLRRSCRFVRHPPDCGVRLEVDEAGVRHDVSLRTVWRDGWRHSRCRGVVGGLLRDARRHVVVERWIRDGGGQLPRADDVQMMGPGSPCCACRCRNRAYGRRGVCLWPPSSSGLDLQGEGHACCECHGAAEILRGGVDEVGRHCVEGQKRNERLEELCRMTVDDGWIGTKHEGHGAHDVGVGYADQKDVTRVDGLGVWNRGVRRRNDDDDWTNPS